MIKLFLALVEAGLMPDFLVRLGIQSLLKDRIKSLADFNSAEFIAELKKSPLAIETAAANQQHYEVQSDFFKLCLGKNLKYSSCLWNEECKDLDSAEDAMLELYLQRADIKDGHNILELGCGWGSLSLFMARRFPNANITGVSNSNSQREYIEGVCKQENIHNLKIITADINVFEQAQTFDRIVSIEMFEHLRNYENLFKKISSWLKPDGKLFVHIFCHKKASYFFETAGDDNWMGKYFFTGGIMPAKNLFENFQADLRLINTWEVNGKNYGKTAAAWLKNQRANKDQILQIFKKIYGNGIDLNVAKMWYYRWEIFYMSCEELFNFDNGKEWFVSHYLFEKK